MRHKSNRFWYIVLFCVLILAAIFSFSGGYLAGRDSVVTTAPQAIVRAVQSTVTALPTHQVTFQPTLKPTQIVTPKPTLKPTQPACQAVNSNPWCYNFNSPGNYITSPPSNFCDYFNCIASFWQSTNGYVDECQDGTYSHSGGAQGACSHHGGELRPLYSH